MKTTNRELQAILKKSVSKIYAMPKFDKRRKMFKDMTLDQYNEIEQKRFDRARVSKVEPISKWQRIREIIQRGKDSKGTNYFKSLIEGNCNIYLANPDYAHADYNKALIMPRSEANLKVMALVNSILTK